MLMVVVGLMVRRRILVRHRDPDGEKRAPGYESRRDRKAVARRD